MKQFFLLPFFVMAWALGGLTAQTCTPDTMLPDTVIVSPLPYQADFPERGLQDTACVDTYFETVIQVQIPATIAFGGTEVAIQNVTVVDPGITNLPASFSYTCNPPNCVFLPDSVGCINVYGTAATADVGVHDLKINVLVNTFIAPLPFSLPDGTLVPGNYYFTVREAGADNCTVNTTEVVENAFSLHIQPNPFSDMAKVSVDLPEGGQWSMRLYNALGTEVQSATLSLAQGANSFDLNSSNLPVGMYVFTLQKGALAASGRVLVQR
ncbi:MAG: T9SS type A sorting domain-containing protein [Saprospiraceae bacterium]